MMADRLLFRDAMAKLGAAVNVVTTDGPGGRYGITASAMCSVTDDPPTILVCINRSSASNAVFKANGVMCVNVLTGSHAALSARFAGGAATMEARFGDPSLWTSLETGSPALIDASVALDCQVTSVSEVGTHSVFFCEVADVQMAADAGALIWFNRTYHALEAAAA
jgi:flavin reductase